MIEITKRKKANNISNIKNPLAIAMWDFSWLLRHHRMGEFEDWDLVLDELVERGYNAIRVDCFPYLVASDNDGKVQEEFYCPKEDWNPPLWGNQYSVNINPRKGLLEFLPKCRMRGIKVGLATWFMGHGTGRNEIFNGIEGLVRAWDETLNFLDSNDVLYDILYVDILNEYPLFNGYSWLRRAMVADEKGVEVKDVEYNAAGNEHVLSPKKGVFTTDFHRKFLNQVIEKLRNKWPELDFFASLTQYNEGMSWDDLADISNFSALDMHLWFVTGNKFPEVVKYWEYIHSFKNDVKFDEGYKLIKEYWKNNKEEAVEWMDSKIRRMKIIGDKYSIPIGNTEGWGTIMWMDHPDLDWEFIKESAEICAKLGYKYGFKFNCTSNFTHPQFPGLWNDIQWHKKVTGLIKNGG